MSPRRQCVTRFAGLLLALLPLSDAIAAESGEFVLVEQQRQVFREVYAEAELGNWRPAAKHDALLQQYVLWPDLRAAWLRTRVRNQDYSDVDAFLDKYPVLSASRELRYRYALSLGHSGEFTRYFNLYQQFYQGLEVARLDCLALQAQIDAGRQSRVVNLGVEKWLTGRNQVEECDPVFDHLRQENLLGTTQYRQRFELAIDARQFRIARYLARSLDSRYQNRASQWSAALGDPAAFLTQPEPALDSSDYRRQLLYAAERLANKKPDAAASMWNKIAGHYAFSPKQRADIERHIALWTARRHSSNAESRLRALTPEAVDTEVRRWRIRASLKNRDWPAVISGIEDLQEDEGQDEQWQYWLAEALRHTNQPTLANDILRELASERSYYGFLAADQTGMPYAFTHNRLRADEAVIAGLGRRNAFIRARELFLVGLEGRGRSEWDAAVALLSRKEKLQASILAHRWSWHSRAIATVAAAGHFDDLELRYPMPYSGIFEKHADDSNINRSWALGVARSESLFMRDIRSSAGAIGLMQLMPQTGRETAKTIQLPFSGDATLTNPDSNIRLGTTYLRKMLARFDDNRILATAAYNAGPLNVERWLPEDGSVGALIWIENIPFNETRKYVRRVLTTDAIFHWRLTGNTKPLSKDMTSVTSASGPQQVTKSE